MKDEKMILYVQTSNAPERQYSPLVLARSAKAMGQNPVLYYLGMGLTMLCSGALEQVQLGSFPAASEMFEAALAEGIPIYACEASKQMLGWENVDLRDGVQIVGAATLNDLALDASATLCF